MRLEHYTNNGYDSVVLFDDENKVVGAWPNDHEAVAGFYATNDPDEWHYNHDDWRPEAGIDTLVATITDDGTLVPADEELMTKRREFLQV